MNKNISEGLLTTVRILFGLLWLDGALWKEPPYFGLYKGDALYYWVTRAIEYPVLDLYTWFVKNIVLKNFLFFGWQVLIIESLLAFSFIFGFKTRLFSFLAIAHISSITLSVLNAPHEWYWSYILMYMIALVFITVEGKSLRFSLDSLLNRQK
jgi:thiosulfate dehydrogenase (quinone) large subunit